MALDVPGVLDVLDARDAGAPGDPAVTRHELRILHVSDLHLEEPADAATIDGLGALCRARRAHVLVVVGDLFDHNRVADATIGAAVEALARIPAPVVILPGNHDPYVERCVYSRADFGPSVHVLSTPGGETVELAELGLAIWGRPHVDYDDFRPLSDPPARSKAHWQIALAHGHLVRGPGDASRAYLIDALDIESTERDYVALGHWDVPSDASSRSVVAAYSGSPTRLGACALATLTSHPDGGRTVVVERLAVPGHGDAALSRAR